MLFVLAGVSAWAQTAQQKQPACPSPPQTLPQMRYDQDNRYLENPDCRTEFLDRLKFVPLGAERENKYLSFGAFIRERGEYFSNPTWGSGPPGSAYPMQRYLLHADLHPGDRFRFFGELGSSLETGRTGGPRSGLDVKKMYVNQGFFDLGLWRSGKNTLKLRAGRQEMAFGSSNLVSPRDGRNIRRTFTGFRVTSRTGDWTVDTFAVKVTMDNPGFFDDPPDHGASFWGIYAVRPFRVLPRGNVDLYYMGLDNKNVPFDGKGAGREQRETIGTRLWGPPGHWDYNDEITFQWGRFRSGGIRAWAVSTETGYRLESIPFRPRFGLRAVAFSGDGNPSGRTLGTFNSLYESGPYFSYAELFARRNLIALQPSVRLYLSKKVSLLPNAAIYWRESVSDGLYGVGGNVIISGQNSRTRYIGSHAAAQLRWEVNPHITAFTEYLHFFPAEFLKQSTAGRNMNYWTGWLEFRF